MITWYEIVIVAAMTVAFSGLFVYNEFFRKRDDD